MRRTTSWGCKVLQLPDRAEAVLALVDTLVPGEVTTYGDLAAEVGGGARHVGTIMRRYGHLSAWWRVVRADGSSHDPAASAPRWDEDGLTHDGTRVALHVHRVHQ